MSNSDKLKEEIDRMRAEGLINLKFFWGDEAQGKDKEELYGAVLEVLEETKKWRALPDEEKMRIQIEQSYGYLKKAIKECKFSIDEVISDIDEGKRVQELHSRISRMFGNIEGAMILLGNWVRNSKERK